jgi:hypothetical protein
MKRLASSPTSRVRNWERKDSHLIRSSIKPEKTTNLFLAKIFFNLKNKSLKDSSPWLKIRIFSLFLKNRPKDSNLRTRVRIFDSPLIFAVSFPESVKKTLLAFTGRITMNSPVKQLEQGERKRVLAIWKKKYIYFLIFFISFRSSPLSMATPAKRSPPRLPRPRRPPRRMQMPP